MKAFILLTYIKKCKDRVSELKYHVPMMVILTNSVNTKDADLKKVFETIFKNVDDNLFAKTLFELECNLEKNVLSNIGVGNEEDDRFLYDYDLFRKIEKEDVFRYVFNKEKGSVDFEYKILSANKEISLKYKNSDKDFALIKIGDVKEFSNDFIRNEYGLSTLNAFDRQGIFENIDKSSINVLMGSRAFYEGWDSLRPNIMLYVNIGSKEAQKFILQSIGRGIRISPDGKSRKRLENIQSLNVSPNCYTNALERLFVFATYPDDIANIVETFKEYTGKQKVKLNGIEKIKINQKLLKPIYDSMGHYYQNEDMINEIKLPLNKNNFKELQNDFNGNLGEILIKNIENQDIKIERLLFIKNNLANFVDKKYDYKEISDKSKIFNKIMNFIMQDIKIPTAFDEIDNNEIVSYDNIAIDKDLVKEFEEKIKSIKFSGSNKNLKGVNIEDFINHYYSPILYTNNYNESITNIVYNESEYDFLETIKELKINKIENLVFSRIKEKTDNIFFPYIDKNGKIQKFYSDFVFWYENENEYRIIFIDPKGIDKSGDYFWKIDGFNRFINSNMSNVLDKQIRVVMCIYDYKNKNINNLEKYRENVVNKDGLLGSFRDDYEGGVVLKCF